MIDLLPYELRRHFDDPSVTDVLVNMGRHVWVERNGALERHDDVHPRDLNDCLQRILVPLGRRLDLLSPVVDARLPDGTRLCAVLEPIAVGGTCVALRLFRPHAFDLEDFAPDPRPDVWSEVTHRLIRSPANILVTGATGSGKSSLVATLASASTASERIVIIEDTHELVIDHDHCVRLESRQATSEGRGLVNLDDLLRAALRLRPDRIVVGEVRGCEALTLVQAMSTGHRRCLATVHANSALEGLDRLDVLTMQAASGWTLEDARHLVDSALDLVVHTHRTTNGRRVIAHVASIDGRTGTRRILHRFDERTPCS